ncbi:SsrA-binding protein SmpB [Candidatus Nitrospira salsa]|nr:MAG: SsrA-binding protein [Nitrospirales bacterium]
MTKATPDHVIGTNRKALYDYAIEQKLEAGIVLVGTEVKSLREGKVNLRESYASVDSGQVILHQCHIGGYSHGNQMNHEPIRPRKLLLHQKEIQKIHGKVQQAGLTLIPLRMYFNSRGLAKVELALARGKKHYDRRETVKKREANREIQRAMKSSKS